MQITVVDGHHPFVGLAVQRKKRWSQLVIWLWAPTREKTHKKSMAKEKEKKSSLEDTSVNVDASSKTHQKLFAVRQVNPVI